MLPAQLTTTVGELSGAQLGLLLCYVALLWLPGLAVGALVGLRGWSLAALSPLLTYGLITMIGPWMSGLGLTWRPYDVVRVLLVVLAVLAVLRWLLGRLRSRWTARTGRGGRQRAPLPAWTTAGHVAVGLATAGAGLFGAAVLLAAFGGVAGVPQDWDAMLHANGVRYIAETGNSGVYDMYQVNAFAGGAKVYYPNAYHLAAALVYDLTGASIPEVLNTQSLLMSLMLALGLVALVRAFHGRVALAAFVALVAPMATAVPYDLVWRGPLLPFATGVVLSLAMLVALRFYLDRPSVLAAVPPILCAAGLLGLHPSVLITAALFALPMLAQRWIATPRRVPVELAALVAAGAVCVAVTLPYLVGALSVASTVLDFTWPQPLSPAQAIGEVVGFSTTHPVPQYGLVVPLLIGVVGLRSLGQLRWLVVAALTFVTLYVMSAAYDTAWAHTLTSVWWNDMHRLAALAALAMLPFVAHGLVLSYDLVLGRVLRPALARLAWPRPVWTVTGFAVVLTLFLLGTDTGYAQRNIDRTASNYGLGRTVSEAEIHGFQALAKLVPPGERVLNDRYDGSGWMYALAGVHPVAAHFGDMSVGAEPRLLGWAFDAYDVNPAVRAAVADLNVHWVITTPGFVRGDQMVRQPGLDQLYLVKELRLVYDREGVRIYELGNTPVEPPAPVTVADASGDVAQPRPGG